MDQDWSGGEMNYARWFIENTRGIRLNILVRILAGLLQTVLALLVVWLSKMLIDDVAMTGTIVEMAIQALLIAVAVVAGVGIRQVNQYLANNSFTLIPQHYYKYNFLST